MTVKKNCWPFSMKTNMLFVILLTSFLTARGQAVDENRTLFIDSGFIAPIQQARDTIRAMMKKKLIPGLSICVSSKGRIVWAEGFGYSDLENKVEVRINTRFRVGSISKSITATGLARMIDERRMNLDSPVAAYLSWFPPKKYPITIRQVASHTAGIRHYKSPAEFVNKTHYSSVKESISIFKDDSLLFVPGTRYSYSSYGYNLLSAAMETASGQPFPAYMKENIFKPLGMNNTSPDYTDSIIPNRSRFYQIQFNELVNAPYVDNSNKWAGGGFLSTPADLVKMANALLYKKFISDNTIHELWTPYKLSGDAATIYGIGFRIEKDKSGRNQIHHGGTSMGGRAFLAIYPDDDIVMAIAYNVLPGNYYEVMLADIFLDSRK